MKVTCRNLLPVEQGVTLRFNSSPKTLTVRQESSDRATRSITSASHISASVSSQSRSIKIQWQSRSYKSSTRGLKRKSSVKSRQPRARFVEGPTAYSSDYFRSNRKQHLKYVRKAHRQLQCWSRRLARAQFRTKHRLCAVLWTTRLSIKRTLCINQRKWLRGFGIWSPHRLKRSAWLMVPNKVISHNTIMVSKAKPALAESLVGALTKFVGSNRLSRFVVAGFSSLFTTAHFLSLPLCFRLLSRWRREAIYLLTKLRNTQACRQSQIQKAKEFSRWLQRNIKRAHRWSQFKKDASRSPGPGESSSGIGRPTDFPGVQARGDRSRMVQQSDDPSQENPGQTSGDRLHFPAPTRNLEVMESGASDFSWMTKTECIVVNWTHRVPYSRCASLRRPIAVYIEEDEDVKKNFVSRHQAYSELGDKGGRTPQEHFR